MNQTSSSVYPPVLSHKMTPQSWFSQQASKHTKANFCRRGVAVGQSELKLKARHPTAPHFIILLQRSKTILRFLHQTLGPAFFYTACSFFFNQGVCARF